MSIFDRIVFSIYTLCFVLISIIITLLPFNLMQIYIKNDILFFLNSLEGKLWISLIGLVILFVSLRLLFSGINISKKSKYIVKYTNLGELKISLQTIEGLTYSVTNNFNEIKDVKANVEIIDGELIILIEAKVSPNVNIPEIIIKVQERIKEHVQNCTGIKVREVRLKIKGVTSSVKTIK